METLSKSPEAPLPYEPIALELSESDINTAMQLYLNFLKLPDTMKQSITHFDETMPRTGTSGYVYKDNKDIKHVFHMTQLLDKKFAERHKLNRETSDFLEAAREIYYSVNHSVKNKYWELEEEIPMLVGLHFPTSGKLRHHLRFLAYQDSQDGTLAHGHYDKGSGTVAIAESHGGLRIGHGPNDLQSIERDNYNPLFFPGFGWHQLAEMLDVVPIRKAAWHDVVDNGERVDDKVMRWALVMFVDPANMYLESSQEQTHTPIPWRGLGNMALRSDNKSFLL